MAVVVCEATRSFASARERWWYLAISRCYNTTIPVCEFRCLFHYCATNNMKLLGVYSFCIDLRRFSTDTVVKMRNFRWWNAIRKRCKMKGGIYWNAGRQYSSLMERHVSASNSTLIAAQTIKWTIKHDEERMFLVILGNGSEISSSHQKDTKYDSLEIAVDLQIRIFFLVCVLSELGTRQDIFVILLSVKGIQAITSGFVKLHYKEIPRCRIKMT